MSGELVSLANEVIPYVSAAVGAYGGAVLTKVRDETADATVGLGRRLLQRIFGSRREGEPPPEPIADVVADPADKDALAALRLAIRKALATSPELQAEVRSMLEQAGEITQNVSAGRDAFVAGRDINHHTTFNHFAWSDRSPTGEQVPPEPLKPRYHHLPMGTQPWITEHRIGVFNSSGQTARRVRIHLVRMEPYPRHYTPGWPRPIIPYTVPLLSGGDPHVGVTINSKQEELWIVGYTATGSDGIMNAGGFSAPDYRWHGTPWRVDPDERWRLSYEVVSEDRPDAKFSIAISPIDGHLKCALEG